MCVNCFNFSHISESKSDMVKAAALIVGAVALPDKTMTPLQFYKYCVEHMSDPACDIFGKKARERV